MKTIIAGSRGINDLDQVIEAVLQSRFDITEVVSGTASGVDRLGESFAREHNCPVKRFPADWKQFGKSAGPRRNKQMGDYADVLIAVWDGKSRGTKQMIEYMKSLGKPVYVHEVKL